MATEAANGWQCTKCTFINETEGATVCEICGEGTKPAAGKGKGRLRARNPANPPPRISSFADALNERDESSARSSGGGRTNTRSRSGRSLKPAAVREEEEEEEEDTEERSTTASSTTRTRTRSSSRGAKQQQQQQQETENHAPLVIYDSDHDQSERETEKSDNDDDDDDDDSGETPLLLGRGWSAGQRDRAKRRKLSRERDQASNNGAGKGSGSAAAPRGKKRQRPPPARPGDDLFRDRAYPAEDDEGDDDGDSDALSPTLNRPVVDGGTRPFWRWPPPPAAMVTCGQGSGTVSPGRRGVVRGGHGGDKMAANGDGGLDLPVVGATGSSEDGSGREGALEVKAERSTAVAGALPPATQEQPKSKKRWVASKRGRFASRRDCLVLLFSTTPHTAGWEGHIGVLSVHV